MESYVVAEVTGIGTNWRVAVAPDGDRYIVSVSSGPVTKEVETFPWGEEQPMSQAFAEAMALVVVSVQTEIEGEVG